MVAHGDHGVSLVEMGVWNWLYENPEATPAQLRDKTLDIAVEEWNKYFAPVLGVSDSPLLAIYSHMINTLFTWPTMPTGR